MTDVIVQWVGWARGCSLGTARADVRLDPLGIPHQPTALPAGRQGIYGFRYQGTWLKIGKAGPKSGARWLSHHYGAGRAMSTLAFSLLRYGHLAADETPSLPGLRAKLQRVGPGEIGQWIRQNTERVNVLLRAEMGLAALAHLESIAHRILQPVFEGPWRFGGPGIAAGLQNLPMNEIPEPEHVGASQRTHVIGRTLGVATVGFDLWLGDTYWSKGFFNVPVPFASFLTTTNGPLDVFLGDSTQPAIGRVERSSNQNGTPRIFGRRPLVEFFRTHCTRGGLVRIEIISPTAVRVDCLTAKNGFCT